MNAAKNGDAGNLAQCYALVQEQQQNRFMAAPGQQGVTPSLMQMNHAMQVPDMLHKSADDAIDAAATQITPAQQDAINKVLAAFGVSTGSALPDTMKMLLVKAMQEQPGATRTVQLQRPR
jgi:hypothetical protein